MGNDFAKGFDKKVMQILAFEEFVKKKESLRDSLEISMLDNIGRFNNDFKKRMFKSIYSVRLLYHLKNISMEAENDYQLKKSLKKLLTMGPSIKNTDDKKEEEIFVTQGARQKPKGKTVINVILKNNQKKSGKLN